MPRPSGRSRRTPQYSGKTYQNLLARLAANVRRLRSAHGWTQEEAAYRCGMTTAFFQSVEGEATNPTGTTLARLADGLATDVSELLHNAEPLPPRRPGRPAKTIAQDDAVTPKPVAAGDEKPAATDEESVEKPEAEDSTAGTARESVD